MSLDFTQWWTWLVILIIIIAIVWFYVRFIETKEENDITVTSSRTQTSEHTKNNIYSSKDYVPYKGKKPVISSIDEISEYERTADDYKYSGKQYEHTDGGPALPSHILESTQTINQSKGEAECRRILEDIYGMRFRVQVRDLPELRNPKTGNILELDLYCPELKLACEYHGRQHYELVPFFHKNGQKDLDYQQWKDNIKVDMCDSAGIYMITVPYNVEIKNIRKFIEYYLPDKVAARRDALNEAVSCERDNVPRSSALKEELFRS